MEAILMVTGEKMPGIVGGFWIVREFRDQASVALWTLFFLPKSLYFNSVENDINSCKVPKIQIFLSVFAYIFVPYLTWIPQIYMIDCIMYQG